MLCSCSILQYNFHFAISFIIFICVVIDIFFSNSLNKMKIHAGTFFVYLTISTLLSTVRFWSQRQTDPRFFPVKKRWTMSWVMGEVRGRLQVTFWLVLHMGLQWMKSMTSAKFVYISTLETCRMSSDSESVECPSLLPMTKTYKSIGYILASCDL